jgi:hypothetical protein
LKAFENAVLREIGWNLNQTPHAYPAIGHHGCVKPRTIIRGIKLLAPFAARRTAREYSAKQAKDLSPTRRMVLQMQPSRFTAVRR